MTGQRRSRLWPADPSRKVEQVINRDDPDPASLTPVSQEPAERVQEGWAALLGGGAA